MKSNTQTIVCLVPERLPREGGHDDGSGVATEDRMSHPIRTPLVAILASSHPLLAPRRRPVAPR